MVAGQNIIDREYNLGNLGNLADMRKLELVCKRMSVSDGVLGVSDEVLGGFTSDLDAGLAAVHAGEVPRAE